MHPILALAPFFTPGGSVILGWVLTFALVAFIFLFIVWLMTKLIGPPNIPEQFRWILWIITAIALMIFLFLAFGVRIP